MQVCFDKEPLLIRLEKGCDAMVTILRNTILDMFFGNKYSDDGTGIMLAVNFTTGFRIVSIFWIRFFFWM